MNDFKSWEDRLYPSLIPNINYIIKNTPPNGVFYDVGANTGLLTEKVLEKRPDISVVMFEPVERYYNCIDNKFKDIKNVKYFNYALVEEKKDLQISISHENLGWNTLTSIRIYDNIENIKGDSLSNIVSENSISFPDLIKIDVEESEFLVIKGCVDFFKIHKPKKIIMECGVPINEYLRRERINMLEYLSSLGYILYDYDDNKSCDAKFEL